MTIRTIRPSTLVTMLLLSTISALSTGVAADPPPEVTDPVSVPQDAAEAKLSFSFRFAPWEDETAQPVLMELLPLVSLDELADRGQHELTKCMFQLAHLSPSDVERELRPLLGPQGTMLMIPAARQVLIVETGGKLRMIQGVIEAMKRRPDGEQPERLRLRSHSTAPADPTVALKVLQTLLAGEPGVRLAIDPKTNSLIALATDTHHERIRAALQELQRGSSRLFRMRVVPQMSRRIVAPSATQLPPIREVTPSRLRSQQHGNDRTRSPDKPSPQAPIATVPQQPASEEGARESGPKRRLLRAPSGPVRIVHIEGTDLLLIRAGGK